MTRPSPDVPARLGRYEIVERLSAGGMGEVFVARFVGPGGFVKAVAVKRIHPHLAQNQAFINMLFDEARVASVIRHANIVSTVDVGSEGTDHFVVLDYVAGDNLSLVLGRLSKAGVAVPMWVVAWIGAQVAGALHAAHEARNLRGKKLDIIHRDVSLHNILLSDQGEPMLFDFGVAKARERLHETTQGQLKGKLSYMAPEIFDGIPVDRSGDVFSLGVVLYELITGVSPFRRDSDIETIAALRRGDVKPPRALRADVDEQLESIVMTAMSRDRSLRYRTARELRDALRGWAMQAKVPHAAEAVATWLAEHLQDRIRSRQDLLARVGDPEGRLSAPPNSERAELSTESIDDLLAGPVSTVDGVSRMTTQPFHPPQVTSWPRRPSLQRGHWVGLALMLGGLVVAVSIIALTFSTGENPAARPLRKTERRVAANAVPPMPASVSVAMPASAVPSATVPPPPRWVPPRTAKTKPTKGPILRNYGP